MTDCHFRDVWCICWWKNHWTICWCLLVVLGFLESKWMGHLRQQKHDEEQVEWRNIPPIQPGQCFQAIQPWGDVLLLLERAGGRPAFVLNINATSHFVQHTFDCSGLLHFVYLSFGCFVQILHLMFFLHILCASRLYLMWGVTGRCAFVLSDTNNVLLPFCAQFHNGRSHIYCTSPSYRCPPMTLPPLVLTIFVNSRLYILLHTRYMSYKWYTVLV